VGLGTPSPRRGRQARKEATVANVKDDEFETLDFADESEYIGDDEDEGGIKEEVADMIADCFGRSVIDCDYDLAERIIARLVPQAS
jgi:hypothetical protein